MRTKRIEMYAPARVWSEVPHGARAAVLRPGMCHERAHVGARQISNASVDISVLNVPHGIAPEHEQDPGRP